MNKKDVDEVDEVLRRAARSSDSVPSAADYKRLCAGWGNHDWLPDAYRNAVCEHLGIPQESFAAFLGDLARIGLSLKIEQCAAHSPFLGMTCALPKGHDDLWHMTYDQIEGERARRGMQADRRFEIAGKRVPGARSAEEAQSADVPTVSKAEVS